MPEIVVSFAKGPRRAPLSGLKLLLGLGLALAAALVGAGVWGVVAAKTETVYFLIPIGVGFVVASALFLPFNEVNVPLGALLFVLCLALTVTSALLGDYLFYSLALAEEFDASLLDAARVVAENFVEIVTEMRETLGSVGLAALGALVGFGNAVRR